MQRVRSSFANSRVSATFIRNFNDSYLGRHYVLGGLPTQVPVLVMIMVAGERRAEVSPLAVRLHGI